MQGRSPIDIGHRSRIAFRSRARQWSRAALALAALFASLPLSSRLFLGVWGFDAAAGVACLCLVAGTYFHVMGRRSLPTMPDPASELDQALELARLGQPAEAIAMLTGIIRLNPWVWQALQYRGELHLSRPDTVSRAIEDFSEAIRLAPGEAHLYNLRGYAYGLLGDQSCAARDIETAATLGKQTVVPIRTAAGPPA